MPYLGSWKIDDYLYFYCNTHDPDTGVATDADAVPTYRVYENEAGTAIVTGSMAKLDDANTVGFYSEEMQLTAASGFEKGKQYVVYISATVDSDTGTMHHTFQIEAEVDVNTASGLHADWTDGGRLDLLIDAIKAVTDNLPDSGALNDLAAILADTGTDGVVISAATANQIADALLKRDFSSVSGEAARSVLNALRFLRNKVAVSGATLTVYKEDDTTPSWTGAVTTDAAADPVVSVDPA